MVHNGQCLEQLTDVSVGPGSQASKENGSGAHWESRLPSGRSCFLLIVQSPPGSLESLQNGEAGSDQTPLLEGLEPHLEDIKSSVIQSLHWEPGSHMGF